MKKRSYKIPKDWITQRGTGYPNRIRAITTKELRAFIDEVIIQSRQEAVEVVDRVAKHFNAIRVDGNKWAFPEHPHTQLRARENYEIARVLEAFDEELKSLSSTEEK